MTKYTYNFSYHVQNLYIASYIIKHVIIAFYVYYKCMNYTSKVACTLL